MKRFLALLLILLSTTGCGDASDQNGVPDLDRPAGETPPAQDQGSLTAAEPQISGHADGAPRGCGPRDIAQRAADMFAAISRGDPDVVEVYMGWSRGAPFQWYSMTEGIPSRPEEKNHFVAYRFDDLEGTCASDTSMGNRYNFAASSLTVGNRCEELCTWVRSNCGEMPTIFPPDLAGRNDSLRARELIIAKQRRSSSSALQ